MGVSDRGSIVDRNISDRVVTVLAFITGFIALGLLALAAYVIIEPITEATVYLLSSLIFLGILVLIAVELNRRRPRSSSQLG